MIAAWMAYATLVTALACLAATAAERAMRLGKRPTRWVWTGAMALACLVPLAAIRREVAPAKPPAAETSITMLRSTPDQALQHVVAFRPLPSTIAVARGSSLSRFDRPLRRAWLTGSLAWCLVLVASALTIARRRRSWTTSVVDAVPVLVSRDVGPAVVGVIQPRIVIPAWVPTLAPAQRALVLAHEQEHARARDPLLLAAGALTLVAMPWNAALWYALGRLRLAVEADCDRRVLRTHPDARAYSSLLVDVTERNLKGTLHLAALGESRSQLARRLALLTARDPRHRSVRMLAAVLLSATCVIIACEAPKPAASAGPSSVPVQRPSEIAVRPDGHVPGTYDSTADRSRDPVSRSAAVKLPGAREGRIGKRSGTDTLMPVSREVIQQALDELAVRPDSMLTPNDVRKLAEFVRSRRIVPDEPAPEDEPPPVPVAVIRRAVETHYPTAFSGRLGGGPHYYWFVGDRTNHVLGSATGREGLGVDEMMILHRGQAPERPIRDAITWGSVVRMVPGTPASMTRRGDRLQLMSFPNGADTVVAVWARLWGESNAR
jgi:beta-lactamase regulating signal transducer with metallopeptidase domain